MMRRLLLPVLALVALAIGGCTVQWVSDPADDRVVLPPDPTGSAASPSVEPPVERFSDVCYDLKDFEDFEGPDDAGYWGSNANRVGVLWATYHSAGRAHEPAAKVQAVSAGDGYWVVVGVVHGETTAWLAWDNQFPDISPYGNFTHWSEIKSVDGWGGGPTPFGVKALASALRCLG